MAYPEIVKGGCLTHTSNNNRPVFIQTNTICEAAKYFFLNIILKEGVLEPPSTPSGYATGFKHFDGLKDSCWLRWGRQFDKHFSLFSKTGFDEAKK